MIELINMLKYGSIWAFCIMLGLVVYGVVKAWVASVAQGVANDAVKWHVATRIIHNEEDLRAYIDSRIAEYEIEQAQFHKKKGKK